MQRKDEEMGLAFFWTNNERYSEPDHLYQSCLCYGKGLFKSLTVTVMLVASLCRWLYDGDWFEMLEAESLCWQLLSLCWWFFNVLYDIICVIISYNLYRSPTSWISHQHLKHIWSPTSVTNINVTYIFERTRRAQKVSPISL